MSPLMRCGDVTDAKMTATGDPVCLAHVGTSLDVEARTPAPEPDLTGRKSKCGSCGRLANSDGTHPSALTRLLGYTERERLTIVYVPNDDPDSRATVVGAVTLQTGDTHRDGSPAPDGMWLTEDGHDRPHWIPLARVRQVNGYPCNGREWRGPQPFLKVNPDYNDDTGRYDTHYDGCRGWS